MDKMSFSLWTVFAVAFQKQSPIPQGGTGRLLFLQTTDELGAQVGTPAEPCLPSRACSSPEDPDCVIHKDPGSTPK